MRRYIDITDIEIPSDENDYDELVAFADAIAEQEIIQLPERKKGKWILDPNGIDWNLPGWRCSLCGCRNNNIGVVAKGEGLGQNPLMWAGSKYCPNCGADMRGDSDEQETTQTQL